MQCSGWALLHSEVISCQASVVDVEDQAGIVDGGIKHLQQVCKRRILFRLQLRIGAICSRENKHVGDQLLQSAAEENDTLKEYYQGLCHWK